MNMPEPRDWAENAAGEMEAVYRMTPEELEAIPIAVDPEFVFAIKGGKLVRVPVGKPAQSPGQESPQVGR